jgi:RNA polymerase sigma factor (TIGR02999 family)
MSEVTRILNAIDQGDPKASEILLPLVYDELRKLAASKLAGEPAGQTLQPTALVHEAWLKLTGTDHEWDGRTHFFAAAATAMRRILVDNARRKRAAMNGGNQQRVNVEDVEISFPAVTDEILAVDEGLEKFAKIYPIKAKVVELRYFGGLTVDEIAAHMGIAPRTAARYYDFAHAWLYKELYPLRRQ